MPDSQNRLTYLYERFIDDTATPEEAAEFWKLFREAAADDPVMGAIFHKYESPVPVGELAPVDWQRALERILRLEQQGVQATGEGKGREGAEVRIRAREDERERVRAENGKGEEERLRAEIEEASDISGGRRFYWWAAAAVVMVLLGMGWWYRQHNVPYQPGETKAVAVYTPPGHSGAILTLGQGQQVILDSIANGNVALQGNTQVLKTDGGIVYNAGGSANDATGGGSKHGKAGQEGVTYNTLTVPRGRQFQLMLPDGTEVWLNAASSIIFPTAFVGKERVVELTGEGYFKVKHMTGKPFRVKVNGELIEDIGTEFNINAYPEEGPLRTTLLEGAAGVSADGRHTVLSPGMQAAFDYQQGRFELTHPDLDEVVAWKNGKFLFTRTGIQAIMRQIARWYDVDVVYEGDLSGVYLSGIVSRRQSADQLLQVFEETGKVYFIIENGKIIVRRGRADQAK